MPVYNAEPYLEDAVESILTQTFRDFEFLIFDDGSTDRSLEMLKRYAAEDCRVRLHERAHGGHIQLMNEGLAVARGRYIARQDADDISLPTRFERQLDAFAGDHEAVLVSSDLELIDENSEFLFHLSLHCSPEMVAWFQLFYNHIAGHSQVMYTRKAVLDVGPYDESFLLAEDYELWSRFAEHGKIIILPEVLLRYRSHSSSVSSRGNLAQVEMVTRVSRRNLAHIGYPDFEDGQLRAIRGFFKRNSNPDTGIAPGLSEKFVAVRKCFLGKYRKTDGMRRSVEAEINDVVGRRFLNWSSSVNLVEDPLGKLRLLGIVLSWQPLHKWGFWSAAVGRFLGGLIRRNCGR
jgi:glycosyltransferase involved in cell wall biosynthesis